MFCSVFFAAGKMLVVFRCLGMFGNDVVGSPVSELCRRRAGAGASVRGCVQPSPHLLPFSNYFAQPQNAAAQTCRSISSSTRLSVLTQRTSRTPQTSACWAAQPQKLVETLAKLRTPWSCIALYCVFHTASTDVASCGLSTSAHNDTL